MAGELADKEYFENPIVTRSGELRQIAWHNALIRDEQGQIAGALSSGEDITERKQAETELHRANRFLDTIIENIPDMVFLKEAAGLRFVRLNRVGEQLLGLTRAEILGKNDYDFFPKDEAEFFIQKDRETLQGKVIVDIPEELIQTRPGPTPPAHQKSAPAGCERRTRVPARDL